MRRKCEKLLTIALNYYRIYYFTIVLRQPSSILPDHVSPPTSHASIVLVGCAIKMLYSLRRARDLCIYRRTPLHLRSLFHPTVGNSCLVSYIERLILLRHAINYVTDCKWT